MALINKLTALGDAIREQTGGTEPLTLDAMVVTIKNLDFSKTTPINVVPSTNSSFTYDGIEKTPVWQNFDSEQLTISGATSATNAGTHTVYFTPKAGYTWADDSVESKTVTWSIAKATGILSLSATSGTIEGVKGTTKTFTVNYNGDGTISVSSSNTGVATVSISNKTVTVKSVSTGSATITISVGNSNNYTTPSSVTYAATVYVRLWIIGNGVNARSTTGGFPIDWHTDWQVFNSDGSVTLKHSNADATFRHDYWTYNTFDVTNYKKLVVHATAWDTNEAINVGVNTVANRGNKCISKTTVGTVPQTVTLDISSITGYVCFQVDMPYYGRYITLGKVYFEA